jgi:hypothetical protein
MTEYPNTDLTDLFINQLKLTETTFDWSRTYDKAVLYKGKLIPVRTYRLSIRWISEYGPTKSRLEELERHQFRIYCVKNAIDLCNGWFAGHKIAIYEIFATNIMYDEGCFDAAMLGRLACLYKPEN